jgi:GTP cyclohydrolase I
MDRRAVEEAVRALLRAMGHDAVGELAATPGLAAEAWCEELVAGERLDPAALLGEGAVPAEPPTGLVALRDLAVVTVCPHHLLPAHGRGDVFYLPGERVAGLGAVARALDALGRRLALQEETGERMARLLVEALGARGALCRLRLVHTCLVARGARQAGSMVETIAVAGSLAAAGADRELALAALAAERSQT